METINTYKEAESILGNGFERKSIDGTAVYSNKCVGYCKFSEHSGFLTEKQFRQHNCIGKNCEHYLPKIKIKAKGSRIKASSAFDVNELNAAIKNYEGIRIIKAESDFRGNITAYYAAISNYDIKSLEKEIFLKTNVKVTLVKLSYSFENSVEAVMKRR